jgi:hypothetical protein
LTNQGTIRIEGEAGGGTMVTIGLPAYTEAAYPTGAAADAQ